MPKRVPTPPPGDNEPRYLTVVHPYAISGTCNMELPKDRRDFARWVACCIDKNAFFAIFHKPSSRGMVIIEINREYEHIDRILGEHRWSEFLQQPTNEEKGRVTQVFYCTYNTGRIVQKNGWKRIDVDEDWFRSWSSKNRQIKHPYPETHFCDVPVEDRTNLSMCRPLPGAVKTPPPVVDAAPPPVVGSAEWTETKGGDPSSAPTTAQAASSRLGAWGKGAPKTQTTLAKPNPTANGSAKKTAGVPQRSVQKLPAVMGGPVVVKSSNVWHNTSKKPVSPVPVMANWDDDSGPVTREGTPVFPAVLQTTAHQAPAVPPGLPPPKSAWGSDTASSTSRSSAPVLPNEIAAPTAQGSTDRTINLSTASWGSTGASASSPDSDSGPDLTTATESDNPYTVHIRFSESMEEEFHGMGIRAIEDEEELRGLDVMAPMGAWDEPMAGATWDTTDGSGWDNEELEAEDAWKRTQESVKPAMLCTAHGVICKKGICKEYARQLYLAKRAEEVEKRKTTMASKGKKNGRPRDRNAGKKDEDESPERNKLPNAQFRGPGAPVKTNWRGAPRAIVSADAIEKRETAGDVSDDGWGNSDVEIELNAIAVVSTDAVDAASEASWGVPDNAFDPWAVTKQPVAREKGFSGKSQGKKKPAETKVSASWADQVDNESAGGNDGDNFSVVSSKKRGSKRGTSTTSWGTHTAKSSTSGWGSVANANMPW